MVPFKTLNGSFARILKKRLQAKKEMLNSCDESSGMGYNMIRWLSLMVDGKVLPSLSILYSLRDTASAQAQVNASVIALRL